MCFKPAKLKNEVATLNLLAYIVFVVQMTARFLYAWQKITIFAKLMLHIVAKQFFVIAL